MQVSSIASITCLIKFASLSNVNKDFFLYKVLSKQYMSTILNKVRALFNKKEKTALTINNYISIKKLACLLLMSYRPPTSVKIML